MRTTEAARFVEWITRSADGLERSLGRGGGGRADGPSAGNPALVRAPGLQSDSRSDALATAAAVVGMDRHRRAGSRDAVIVLLGVSSGLGVGPSGRRIDIRVDPRVDGGDLRCPHRTGRRMAARFALRRRA